jgi:putative endonuclease
MKRYYVYILANRRNGALYVGKTINLYHRVSEHKKGRGSDFTKRYEVNKLVYFERYDNNSKAFHREKQLKGWKRLWKISLIETANPKWEDFFEELSNS